VTPERARVVDRALAAPYYREKLGAWVRDPTWSTLPFTTKADLRAAYPFGLLAVTSDEIATYHESSGTSGEPTPTFYTEADWDDIASRFARNAVGLGPSDTVLVKTPYSMVTTAHQMHRAARLKGALVIPADNRCANMPYSKVIRLLKDLRVTVVWCLPSEALIWAAAAKAHGLDPRHDFPALRAFIVAGEPLGVAKRQRLEALWGEAKVFEDYGSTETGSLAGDCERGRLHAWTDRLMFELIGADGSVSTEGIGELAITPLFREAQPLLRYRVGDRVELRSGACECGSPFPVIRVLGREESATRIGDLAILPSAIEETVFRLPISDDVMFWRARVREVELDVEIECTDDAVARRLELGFHRDLAIAAHVRCVAAGTIFPTARLTEISRPLKPRHVFAAGDDWNQGLPL
jgi:phenylacetate-CoA ligase